MLWDRGEANGYAQHMTTDPLPNTPPHKVLLHVAFGDHQVATLTAEVEARTIGAVTHAGPLDPGRDPDVDPLFGHPARRFATTLRGLGDRLLGLGLADAADEEPARRATAPTRTATRAATSRPAARSPSSCGSGGVVNERAAAGPATPTGTLARPERPPRSRAGSDLERTQQLRA